MPKYNYSHIPDWLADILEDNDVDVLRVNSTIRDVANAPGNFLRTTNAILPNTLATLYNVATRKKDLASSAALMQGARMFRHGNPNILDLLYATASRDSLYDRPTNAPMRLDPEFYFLLDRPNQDKLLKQAGYISGKEDDYGLVKKAVGNNNYPVYQRQKDAISREELIPIGNGYDDFYGSKNAALAHAGDYPTTTYIDKQGKFYQKAWDLNDYGGNRGGDTAKQKVANILDRLGSPMVFTTGFQPVVPLRESDVGYLAGDASDVYPGIPNNPNADDVFWNIIEPELKKVSNYSEIMKQYYNLLPEVTVTPKKKKTRRLDNTKGK